MTDSATSETTQLLRAWAGGDEGALDALIPRVYRELRRLAGHILRNERPGQTLQPSELVHEAYLKLVDVKQVDWRHRAHFFAVSATVMRRIVLDRARRRVAGKRGAGVTVLNLDAGFDFSLTRSRELIAIDDALTALADFDPRKARVVELRFFVGLGVEETAAIVDVSPQTVMRDWITARAWLLSQVRRR